MIFYAKDLKSSISPSLCRYFGLADSCSSAMWSSTQWRVLGGTMESGYFLPAFRLYHLPYDKREEFVGGFQYQTNLQNLSCLSSHPCIIPAIQLNVCIEYEWDSHGGGNLRGLIYNVLMLPLSGPITTRSLIVGQAWSTVFELYFYSLFAIP